MSKAAGVRTEFVDAGGARVHLLRHGHGRPLVYLHGISDAGRWNHVLESLAQGYTVYAPSHPGFGLSEPAAWVHHVDDLALHYLDLFEALGLRRPVILGASLGGWIAAALAVWQPRLPCCLALVDPAGIGLPEVDQPDIFGMPRQERLRVLYASEEAGRLVEPEDPSGQDIERVYRDRATLAHLAWQPYLRDPALRGRLRRVSTPTQLIWGNKDQLLPLPIAHAWAAALPSATLEVIDEAGHAPLLEQPAAVLDRLAPFLRRWSGGEQD